MGIGKAGAMVIVLSGGPVRVGDSAHHIAAHRMILLQTEPLTVMVLRLINPC